jgi:hypothetical protein
MEIDESIIRLGQKLDAWWDGTQPLLGSEDRAAQGKALLQGFEIAKEFDLLKVQGLAAITALLNRHDATTEDERVSSLVRGFEFAAKLAATLHDEFRDTDGETEVAHLMYAIASTLDVIGSGRAVLAVLLDHADAGVRASAGAYLLIMNLMSERVVPILRDIEKNEDANSAHFRAYWAILRWERDGEHGAANK